MKLILTRIEEGQAQRIIFAEVIAVNVITADGASIIRVMVPGNVTLDFPDHLSNTKALELWSNTD